MRNDQHDVVAALMRLPFRQAQEADLHPGASQPEVVTLPLTVQQLASLTVQQPANLHLTHASSGRAPQPAEKASA